MTLDAWGRHTMPGGDFNYEACDEFERLLTSNWDAVAFCQENSIDAIEVSLNNCKVADMTVRQVCRRLQEAVDYAHSHAEHWDWLHFDVEGCTDDE